MRPNCVLGNSSRTTRSNGTGSPCTGDQRSQGESHERCRDMERGASEARNPSERCVDEFYTCLSLSNVSVDLETRIQNAREPVDIVPTRSHDRIDLGVLACMQESLRETHLQEQGQTNKRQLDCDTDDAPPSKKQKVSETHMIAEVYKQLIDLYPSPTSVLQFEGSTQQNWKWS